VVHAKGAACGAGFSVDAGDAGLDVCAAFPSHAVIPFFRTHISKFVNKIVGKVMFWAWSSPLAP
jgi:hypothetical protein